MAVNDGSVDGGRVRGVDHAGYVVTNLDQAVAFFVDVLGFDDINRRDTLADDEGDSMTRRFGVHPRAVARYAFVERGGSKIELLEWTSPGQNPDPPRNSDAGGRHLALAVDDVEALLGRLTSVPGMQIREPNERGFVYVGTPFGLEIQLIPG